MPPQVVIVGGGFGGLEAAKKLRKAPVEVTLIDRNNYHLFQPLLYQVGTGGLSPANISTPLRSILGRQTNCRIVLGEVHDFNLESRSVVLENEEILYDYLIVAAGAQTSFFGNDHWERYAAGLKSLEDALRMRRQIFLAFEAAEQASDEAQRRALMTFVVVGGGPTGVELAGALSEIARHTLKHDFRRIDPSESRIILLEAGETVLSEYPSDLCERAILDLRRLGVDVRTGTKVIRIKQDEVVTASNNTQTTIPAHTVLWAAGVAANPLAKRLAEITGIKLDRGGRLPVDASLRVAGHENLFVIGDMAAVRDQDNQMLPGVAPVAMQQGQHVAKLIQQAVKGRNSDSPFRYRDLGSMATIGRAAAIAKIGRFKFRGLLAWILWLVVHLVQIMQVPNRLLILIQWSWNYFTFNRAARIITPTATRRRSAPTEPQAATSASPELVESSGT